MQAADSLEFNHPALLRQLCRSPPVVIIRVARKDALEVELAQNDYVIQTLSSDRTVYAFSIRILPR